VNKLVGSTVSATQCQIEEVVASTGRVRTLAGAIQLHAQPPPNSAPGRLRVRFNGCGGIAVDRRGNVVFSIGEQGVLMEINPHTLVLRRYARVPAGTVVALTFGSHGDLYFSDAGANVVRRMTPDGRIQRVAGVSGLGMYWGDGGKASQASLYNPEGLAFDGRGHLYIADEANGRVRRVDLRTGIITTVAGGGSCRKRNQLFCGAGGDPRRARLDGPNDVGVDAQGNIYIAAARLLRITAQSDRLQIVAGNGKTPTTSAAARSQLKPQRGQRAELEASFLVIGSDRTIYVAEPGLGTLRVVTLPPG
jgi:sugar lactone lactonase YvrE